MTVERWIRVVAGMFVLLSVALSVPECPLFVSRKFLFFTTFVGFMLFQSGFTRFCPMEIVLRTLGVKASAGAAAK